MFNPGDVVDHTFYSHLRSGRVLKSHKMSCFVDWGEGNGGASHLIANLTLVKRTITKEQLDSLREDI